jgi:hypothetical protein
MVLAVASIITAGLTSYVNITMAMNSASPIVPPIMPASETEWINFALWFEDGAFV